MPVLWSERRPGTEPPSPRVSFLHSSQSKSDPERWRCRVSSPTGDDSEIYAPATPTCPSADRSQLSSVGLPFHGLAPYHNHLPLDHPDNAGAVSWLIGEGAEREDAGACAAAAAQDGSGQDAPEASRWAHASAGSSVGDFLRDAPVVRERGAASSCPWLRMATTGRRRGPGRVHAGPHHLCRPRKRTALDLVVENVRCLRQEGTQFVRGRAHPKKLISA